MRADYDPAVGTVVVTGGRPILSVDAVLDLRGEACPYPPVYTAEALATMRPGQILEVLTDHPPAVDNVPRFVAIHGHRLVHAPVRDGAVYHLFIRVGGEGSGEGGDGRREDRSTS